MGDVITIGADLAKSVFQIHGVDEEGVVVVRRQLRRRQVLPFFEKLRPCLVGMEACATAHHWGREIERLGHRVRLMPPRYVKAYVKIQKKRLRGGDQADDALCRAAPGEPADSGGRPAGSLAWHPSNEASRRLDRIPGIGPLIATALVASVPNPQAFKSGRDLAAWIGLVPKQKLERCQGAARRHLHAWEPLLAHLSYLLCRSLCLRGMRC
jgi:transposase